MTQDRSASRYDVAAAVCATAAVSVFAFRGLASWWVIAGWSLTLVTVGLRVVEYRRVVRELAEPATPGDPA